MKGIVGLFAASWLSAADPDVWKHKDPVFPSTTSPARGSAPPGFCENVAVPSDKSMEKDCTVLPPGVTKMDVMNIDEQRMLSIAKANAYIGVAIKYGQLGDREIDRGPFGGRTRFSSSITEPQALAGVHDPKSLESGRQLFEAGRAVLVEDVISINAAGQLLRTYTAYEIFAYERKRVLAPSVTLVLEMESQSQDETFEELTLQFHRVVLAYINLDNGEKVEIPSFAVKANS